MAIPTFDVIPFIVVFHTKCVNTVFFIEVIRLIVRPSCKVPLTAIRPSKVTLRGDVIQAQPGFVSIMAMLNINIFLIVGHINKDRLFLTTFGESCCPIDAFFTRQITESIEIAPPRVTDIFGNMTFQKRPWADGYWLMLTVIMLLIGDITRRQERRLHQDKPEVIHSKFMPNYTMSVRENCFLYEKKAKQWFHVTSVHVTYVTVRPIKIWWFAVVNRLRHKIKYFSC